MWFAHSIPDADRAGWEGLRQHLEAVARRAGGFGAAFGAAEFARAAGLLHDVGKYSAGFQAYLRGEAASVDHATAGARRAQELYGPCLGRILAFCIAGHHAGLANGTNGDRLSALADRLKKQIEDYSDWRQDLCVPERLAPPEWQDDSPHPGFPVAFFTRLVFSCLVDADFLETERFYARIEGRTALRDQWPELASLNPKLEYELRRIEAEADDTPVNQQRARILQAVRAGAAQPAGLFSLTVPTGGGKTLASLAFAIDHAQRHGLRRLIYVIPFTSIVEQTAEIFRRALGADAVLEHHSAFEPGEWRGNEEHEEDRDGAEKVKLAAENWDAPVVVTTAVQFFESLFANRGSRCRKLHNIAKSVVVLDEAQTLPLALLRPCVAAIDELARHYGTTIVLCTATQPALKSPEFAGGLEDVRELAPSGLFEEPAFTRVRIERPPGDGRLADAKLAAMLRAEPQALAIVNSRAHARALFEAIRETEGACHLSTLMYAAHRQRVLAAVRERLKRGLPVRLVSTSLIEAGVDISFPIVFRAEAGLDSIAQAAGRCNRHGELDRLGRVLVFQAPDQKIPPEIGQLTGAGREVLRHFDDPLSPDAIRRFFELTYFLKGPGALDEKKILQMCAERARSLDFPFETMAHAFRMIENVMMPIVIPRDAEARDALNALEHAERAGRLARRLQRYLVPVPRAVRAGLVDAGAARFVQPERFGEQFARLENLELYREDTGLLWDDPTARAAEGLVL